jgi:hypothetical protein
LHFPLDVKIVYLVEISDILKRSFQTKYPIMLIKRTKQNICFPWHNITDISSFITEYWNSTYNLINPIHKKRKEYIIKDFFQIRLKKGTEHRNISIK